MPLVRYEIRNEFSLAKPDLYTTVPKNDPELLLEGVAVAGLLGIVRQLGDLAEFATEVFHGLHEEVLATAAKGHELLERLHQLELELPTVENLMLSKSNRLKFAYNSGIEWHPYISDGQNNFSQGDLPQFIHNAYEQCRGPPRLFLLDKFDKAAGACLKRYTDPSFFKREWAKSELMNAEKEWKARKTRRNQRKSRQKDNDYNKRAKARSCVHARVETPAVDIKETSSVLKDGTAENRKMQDHARARKLENPVKVIATVQLSGQDNRIPKVSRISSQHLLQMDSEKYVHVNNDPAGPYPKQEEEAIVAIQSTSMGSPQHLLQLESETCVYVDNDPEKHVEKPDLRQEENVIVTNELGSSQLLMQINSETCVNNGSTIHVGQQPNLRHGDDVVLVNESNSMSYLQLMLQLDSQKCVNNDSAAHVEQPKLRQKDDAIVANEATWKSFCPEECTQEYRNIHDHMRKWKPEEQVNFMAPVHLTTEDKIVTNTWIDSSQLFERDSMNVINDPAEHIEHPDVDQGMDVTEEPSAKACSLDQAITEHVSIMANGPVSTKDIDMLMGLEQSVGDNIDTRLPLEFLNLSQGDDVLQGTGSCMDEVTSKSSEVSTDLEMVGYVSHQFRHEINGNISRFQNSDQEQCLRSDRLDKGKSEILKGTQSSLLGDTQKRNFTEDEHISSPWAYEDSPSADSNVASECLSGTVSTTSKSPANMDETCFQKSGFILSHNTETNSMTGSGKQSPKLGKSKLSNSRHNTENVSDDNEMFSDVPIIIKNKLNAVESISDVPIIIKNKLNAVESISLPQQSGTFSSSPQQSGTFSSSPRQSGNFSSSPPQSGNFCSSPLQSGNFCSSPQQSGNFNIQPEIMKYCIQDMESKFSTSSDELFQSQFTNIEPSQCASPRSCIDRSDDSDGDMDGMYVSSTSSSPRPSTLATNVIMGSSPPSPSVSDGMSSLCSSSESIMKPTLLSITSENDITCIVDIPVSDGESSEKFHSHVDIPVSESMYVSSTSSSPRPSTLATNVIMGSSPPSPSVSDGMSSLCSSSESIMKPTLLSITSENDITCIPQGNVSYPSKPQNSDICISGSSEKSDSDVKIPGNISIDPVVLVEKAVDVSSSSLATNVIMESSPPSPSISIGMSSLCSSSELVMKITLHSITSENDLTGIPQGNVSYPSKPQNSDICTSGSSEKSDPNVNIPGNVSVDPVVLVEKAVDLSSSSLTTNVIMESSPPSPSGSVGMSSLCSSSESIMIPTLHSITSENDTTCIPQGNVSFLSKPQNSDIFVSRSSEKSDSNVDIPGNVFIDPVVLVEKAVDVSSSILATNVIMESIPPSPSIASESELRSVPLGNGCTCESSEKFDSHVDIPVSDGESSEKFHSHVDIPVSDGESSEKFGSHIDIPVSDDPAALIDKAERYPHPPPLPPVEWRTTDKINGEYSSKIPPFPAKLLMRRDLLASSFKPLLMNYLAELNIPGTSAEPSEFSTSAPSTPYNRFLREEDSQFPVPSFHLNRLSQVSLSAEPEPDIRSGDVICPASTSDFFVSDTNSDDILHQTSEEKENVKVESLPGSLQSSSKKTPVESDSPNISRKVFKSKTELVLLEKYGSFNLQREKLDFPRRFTNINVAAILEKANAIRQTLAGSDDDSDNNDDWSDT